MIYSAIYKMDTSVQFEQGYTHLRSVRVTDRNKLCTSGFSVRLTLGHIVSCMSTLSAYERSVRMDEFSIQKTENKYHRKDTHRKGTGKNICSTNPKNQLYSVHNFFRSILAINIIYLKNIQI